MSPVETWCRNINYFIPEEGKTKQFTVEQMTKIRKSKYQFLILKSSYGNHIINKIQRYGLDIYSQNISDISNIILHTKKFLSSAAFMFLITPKQFLLLKNINMRSQNDLPMNAGYCVF